MDKKQVRQNKIQKRRLLKRKKSEPEQYLISTQEYENDVK